MLIMASGESPRLLASNHLCLQGANKPLTMLLFRARDNCDCVNAALPCTFFALASWADWPFCLSEEFFDVCALAFAAGYVFPSMGCTLVGREGGRAGGPEGV